MKKFTRNEIVIIIMEAIKTCVSEFTGPFLIAYFISSAISNITSYSFYKIVGNIATIITSYIVSRFIKKKNKMVSLRIGIVVSSLYLLALFYFKDSLISNSWIIGILLGISGSMYYMPYNYLLSNMIRDEQMNKWTSIKTMVNYIICIVTPLLLGILLTKFNYSDLVIYFVILQLISLIATFLLEDKEKKVCSFSIHKFYDKVKECNALDVFKRLFTIDLINGFVLSDSALATTITLFVVLSFKTNLSLGVFSSIFTILNVIISYFFSKLKGKGKYPFYIICSTILIITSMLVFMLYTNNITFIIYNLFYRIATVMISIMIFSDTISESNDVIAVKRSFQVEYFTVREVALSVGRSLSFILLLIAGLINKIFVYQLLLLIFSLCIVLMAITMVRLHKNKNQD